MTVPVMKVPTPVLLILVVPPVENTPLVVSKFPAAVTLPELSIRNLVVPAADAVNKSVASKAGWFTTNAARPRDTDPAIFTLAEDVAVSPNTVSKVKLPGAKVPVPNCQ